MEYNTYDYFQEKINDYTKKSMLLGTAICRFRNLHDNLDTPELYNIENWGADKNILVPDFTSIVDKDVFTNKQFNNMYINGLIKSYLYFINIQANNVLIRKANTYIKSLKISYSNFVGLTIDGKIDRLSLNECTIDNRLKIKGHISELNFNLVKANTFDFFEYNGHIEFYDIMFIDILILPYNQQYISAITLSNLIGLKKLVVSNNFKHIDGDECKINEFNNKIKSGEIIKEIISFEEYNKRYNA